MPALLPALALLMAPALVTAPVLLHRWQEVPVSTLLLLALLQELLPLALRHWLLPLDPWPSPALLPLGMLPALLPALLATPLRGKRALLQAASLPVRVAGHALQHG